MSDDLRKKLHGIVDTIFDGVDALELVRQLVPNTSKSSGGEALDSTTKPSPKVVTPSTKSCTPSLPSGPESSDSHSESSCGGELKDGSSVQAAVYPRKSKQP